MATINDQIDIAEFEVESNIKYDSEKIKKTLIKSKKYI